MLFWNGQSHDGEERVEMEDAARIQPRVKVPRRTIYFASGETMEEYSTDEEEEEEERTKQDVSTVDTVGPDCWLFTHDSSLPI